MDDLQKAIGVILAVRDCPTVQRLMLDLWALGLKHGEAEGLRYAQMYLNGIKRYTAAQAVADGMSLSRYTNDDGEHR